MSDVQSYWESFAVVRGQDTIQGIYPQIHRRGYIAGSFAAFMMAECDNPILPNDIDIFATSNANADIIRKRLVGPKDHYTENDIAISVTRGRNEIGLQIIKPRPDWTDFPNCLLESFDMDVCRAVLIAPNTVMADVNAGLHRGKFLKINNPLRSLRRAMKYSARGVEFNDHELLKLFQCWEAMPDERKAEMLKFAADELSPLEIDGSSGGWDYDEDDYFDAE